MFLVFFGFGGGVEFCTDCGGVVVVVVVVFLLPIDELIAVFIGGLGVAGGNDIVVAFFGLLMADFRKLITLATGGSFVVLPEGEERWLGKSGAVV